MNGWLTRLQLAIAALCLLAATAAAQEVLRPFVRGSWQEIRAAHAGRPFVVHVWGVSCAPCRTEMPMWGRLMQAHPQLALVTIHADRVPDESSAMAEMLGSSGLSGAENWWFAERFFERLRFEVDPHWQGEIPMTLLISAAGEITTIIGSAEPEEVVRWLAVAARPQH